MNDAPMVTLHAWRVPGRALPRVLHRMAVDRATLRRLPGVRFAKLLGTGTGASFGPTDVDPTRWAAVVAWDDPAAARAFDAGPVGKRWAAISTERVRLDLRTLHTRGAWSGAQPFDGRPPIAPHYGADTERAAHDGAGTRRPVHDGPQLALTRARLRPTRAVTFWRAIPPVAATLRDAPGLLASFGIGEAPIGWQGTISVWRSGADLVRFAYRQPEHRAAMAATERLGWYAEELFARFAVCGVTGDRSVLGWSTDLTDGNG